MGLVLRIGLWGLLVLFLGAVMFILYALTALSGVFVKKEDPTALAAALAEHMTILRPTGPGPFPTVLQFHGCGGLETHDGQRQPIMEEYAAEAVTRGIAVVTVESFPHRGISREHALARVCSGREFRGSERAGDVLAALEHVRSLDFVQKDKIALAGWSHGGWAIMDLMAMDLRRTRPHNLARAPEDGLRGVAAVYLTYPYAGAVSRTRYTGWAHIAPTRVVISNADSVVANTGTYRSIKKIEESGATVDVRVFEGVDHAFDERFLEPGSSLEFHADLAETARREYADWLAQTLGATPQPIVAPAADVSGDTGADAPPVSNTGEGEADGDGRP